MFSKFKINCLQFSRKGLGLGGEKLLKFNLYFPVKRNLSSVVEINNEEKTNALANYVLRLNASKLKLNEDWVVVDKNIFEKVTKYDNGEMYFPVFESKNKNKIYIKQIGSFLSMLITCLIFFYFTIKLCRNKYIEYKKEFCSRREVLLYSIPLFLNIVALVAIVKNPLYKLWIFIKKIELARDLKTLRITTYTNKVFKTDISKVYLIQKGTSTYYNYKTQEKVYEFFTIGVGKKVYIIQLKNCMVNKDLFNLCIRGYKLKV